MSIILQKTNESEWIFIHDFYFESSEPDAPKARFEDLNRDDQELAYSQYPLDKYMTVRDGKILVGFVGLFPDGDENVGLFYVISPEQRGKGYFSQMLRLTIEYCQREFIECRAIRVLTRKQNRASIRGLEKSMFTRRGTAVDQLVPGEIYEEYFYPIRGELPNLS